MKTINKFLFIITLLFYCGVLNVSGQLKTITFKEYLNNVKNNNISYIVEKFNVNIAEANVQASKVFPDPELSFSASDNQEETLHMGRSFEASLEYTIELGRKRKARVQLADSEKELTEALLGSYFHNLRADATLGYLNVLKQKQLLEVIISSYDQMKQLALADSIRYKMGEISEVDAMQSRLEANALWNDVIQYQSEYKNALLELHLFQGGKELNEIDSVTGSLYIQKQVYDLASLIVSALENRSDLIAALKTKKLSEHNLKLVKANRAIDLGLSLGVARNMEVANEIAPAPAFTSVTAGIAIPLKFSNSNKGEIRAAQFAIKQSEANYDAAKIQIRKEVTQAYNTYIAACSQVEQYNNTLLLDAITVLENRTYSYKRGETSLLEVLNARKTYNEICQSYCETLYNNMASLVELERDCGIWDLEF